MDILQFKTKPLQEVEKEISCKVLNSMIKRLVAFVLCENSSFYFCFVRCLKITS